LLQDVESLGEGGNLLGELFHFRPLSDKLVLNDLQLVDSLLLGDLETLGRF
jgi:hypothetical protein